LCAYRETALNGFELPFRWGRRDAESCPESTSRIPGDTDCDEVKGVFLDRMGLTWTDATALLGAHTLGRGSTQHSGHDGMWVQSGQESLIFDNGFYTELLGRTWRPRNNQFDWTWGGNNRDVMMLNTDICLYFDISDTDCCTDNDRQRGCNTRCQISDNDETVNAIDRFAARNNDHQPFYNAFTDAWIKATENGRDGLNNLDEGCTPTSSPPTISPITSTPTTSPTTSIPTISKVPTVSPITPAPTVSPTTSAPTISTAPTASPTTPEPTISLAPSSKECIDRDCQYVADNGLCDVYGALCPVSCNAIGCEKTNCEKILSKSECKENFECTWDQGEELCMEKGENPSKQCEEITKKDKCKVRSQCAWDKATKVCMEKDEIPSNECEEISSESECNGISQCTWDRAEEVCTEKDDNPLNECEKVLSKSQCKENSECTWDKATEICMEKDEIPSSECEEISSKNECNGFLQCTWDKSEKVCTETEEIPSNNCEEITNKDKCKKKSQCAWDKATKLCMEKS